MTTYGRNITLQEDLNQHFGDALDEEGPFMMDEEDENHFNRHYDVMEPQDYAGVDVSGIVMRDEENDQAAYFSMWNETGNGVFAELETDGTEDLVRGYLHE